MKNRKNKFKNQNLKKFKIIMFIKKNFDFEYKNKLRQYFVIFIKKIKFHICKICGEIFSSKNRLYIYLSNRDLRQNDVKNIYFKQLIIHA